MRAKVWHDLCNQSLAWPLGAQPGWHGPDGMGDGGLERPPWWRIKVKEDGVAMAKVKDLSAATKVFSGNVLAKGG